jgi:hypothetical protein
VGLLWWLGGKVWWGTLAADAHIQHAWTALLCYRRVQRVVTTCFSAGACSLLQSSYQILASHAV